jgi:molybdopterin synthase catalytic subunit
MSSHRLLALRERALSVDEALSFVTRPEAGGVVIFAGTVREQNEGRTVSLLEYEAYGAMAERELARICDELEREIPGVRLAVLHRVGRLDVGELAVVCAASAPHREEAFRACRNLIDRIKSRVPIWKREHGPDGPYWIGWQDARTAPSGPK